jgi:hypothetical protein
VALHGEARLQLSSRPQRDLAFETRIAVDPQLNLFAIFREESFVLEGKSDSRIRSWI